MSICPILSVMKLEKVKCIGKECQWWYEASDGGDCAVKRGARYVEHLMAEVPGKLDDMKAGLEDLRLQPERDRQARSKIMEDMRKFGPKIKR